MLCRLTVSKYCLTEHVAQMLEYVWVIAPIYAYYQNWQPVMYQKHDDFKEYIKSLGLQFCTIESISLAKNQKFMVTEPNNEPFDMQIVNEEEFYLRENLLNVAVNKITNMGFDWEYIAWIDAH